MVPYQKGKAGKMEGNKWYVLQLYEEPNLTLGLYS